MDDERLLAEALRAHAAGGVSTPGGSSAPAPDAQGTTEGDGEGDDRRGSGGSRLRDRFRPLTRGKRGGDAPDEGATETSPRPDPAAHPDPAARPGPAPAGRPTGPAGPAGPAPFPTTGRGAPPPGVRPGPRPAPGTPERPWPQAGPRPPARPAPPLPTGPVTRPGGPQVPHPRSAPGPAPGTAPAGVPTGARPAAAPDGPAPWTAARIAWWSAVALLAGAVVGALAAVGSLGLPG